MPLKINKKFALLYGIMLGDGCLSLLDDRKKYVMIAGSMVDDVPFFEKVLQPILNSLINKTPLLDLDLQKGRYI